MYKKLNNVMVYLILLIILNVGNICGGRGDARRSPFYSYSRQDLHRKIENVMNCVAVGSTIGLVSVYHLLAPREEESLHLACLLAIASTAPVVIKGLLSKGLDLIVKHTLGSYFEVYRQSKLHKKHICHGGFTCYSPQLLDSLSDNKVKVPQEEYNIIKAETRCVKNELIHIKQKNRISRYLIEHLFPYEMTEKKTAVIPSQQCIHQIFTDELPTYVIIEKTPEQIGQLLPFIRLDGWYQTNPPQGKVVIRGNEYPFCSRLSTLMSGGITEMVDKNKRKGG